MSNEPVTIIFDLGNVILPFDPLIPCRVLGDRAGMKAYDACLTIYKNNLERKFEQGLLDGDQFTAAVAEALAIDLDADQFCDLWSSMFVAEDEAVAEIVRSLKPHHRLTLLSNINRWHWAYARDNSPAVGEFDRFALSYEVGALKPHPAIYREALDRAGWPRRAIFIDDTEINAVGAQVLGITGVHFQSAAQLRDDLTRLGCRFDR